MGVKGWGLMRTLPRTEALEQARQRTWPKSIAQTASGWLVEASGVSCARAMLMVVKAQSVAVTTLSMATAHLSVVTVVHLLLVDANLL